jgi:hypothetical protein
MRNTPLGIGAVGALNTAFGFQRKGVTSCGHRCDNSLSHKRIFDLKICARKFERRDGSDMRNLVSGTLSFGHKQRGPFCHCIDVQYFILHEALSNGGIGVFIPVRGHCRTSHDVAPSHRPKRSN